MCRSIVGGRRATAIADTPTAGRISSAWSWQACDRVIASVGQVDVWAFPPGGTHFADARGRQASGPGGPLNSSTSISAPRRFEPGTVPSC
jgi:hypothetical protein